MHSKTQLCSCPCLQLSKSPPCTAASKRSFCSRLCFETLSQLTHAFRIAASLAFPTVCILFRSPPILLLSCANQSATLRRHRVRQDTCTSQHAGNKRRPLLPADQNLKVTPLLVSLLTFKAFNTPCRCNCLVKQCICWYSETCLASRTCAMCILPDGSKPSYATGLGFFSSKFRSSSS